MEVHMLKVHNSHVITYLQSLSHYITLIFFWFTSTTDVMHRLFSIAHMLITQVADVMRDVINLSTPMLQAY